MARETSASDVVFAEDFVAGFEAGLALFSFSTFEELVFAGTAEEGREAPFEGCSG
jgi:hypothetical protein